MNRTQREPGARVRNPCSLAFLVALAVAAGSTSAAEGAEKKLGWSDTAEFSLVVSDGNSKSESLGFKNLLERAWPRANFQFELTAIRAASTDRDAVAVGPGAGDFRVLEVEEEDVSTELFSVGLGYDRKITDRSYWNLGADWLRNRPAEIENRASLLAGFGTLWVDGPVNTYRTEYGLSWVREEFTTSDEEDDYPGFRLVSDWRRKVGASSTYVNRLVLNENLEDTDDLRADWTNSLTVAMNERLALKVSLQFLWDNEPALEELELEFPRGTPTGVLVLSPVEDLDTLFTASLVVNF